MTLGRGSSGEMMQSNSWTGELRILGAGVLQLRTSELDKLIKEVEQEEGDETEQSTLKFIK